MFLSASQLLNPPAPNSPSPPHPPPPPSPHFTLPSVHPHVPLGGICYDLLQRTARSTYTIHACNTHARTPARSPARLAN